MGSGPFEEAIWTLNEIKKMGLGFLPSDMRKFETSQVDTNSVKLNFIKPKDTVIDGNILVKIYGVKIMMRDDRYPENPYDGTVIFDSKNTESTEVDESTGEQSYIVTDLDREKNYYFTCYPYGPRDIFNETNSPDNRSVVYVAGDETITVNVTVDEPDLFPYVNITLNDVTDPNNSITKPINANSSATFEATIFHQYYISSEQVDNFSNPSNTQTFTAIGDGNRTIDFDYMFAANIIRVMVSTDDVENDGQFTTKQVSITAKNISKSTEETITKTGGGEYLFAAINGDAYQILYGEVENYSKPEDTEQFVMAAGTEKTLEAIYSYGELVQLRAVMNSVLAGYVFNWGEPAELFKSKWDNRMVLDNEIAEKINDIMKYSDLSLPVDITDMTTNVTERVYIPINNCHIEHLQNVDCYAIGGSLEHRFKVGTKYKIKPLSELFKPDGYPSKFYEFFDPVGYYIEKSNGSFNTTIFDTDYSDMEHSIFKTTNIYNKETVSGYNADGLYINLTGDWYWTGEYIPVKHVKSMLYYAKGYEHVGGTVVFGYKSYDEVEKILKNHQPSMYYPSYFSYNPYDDYPLQPIGIKAKVDTIANVGVFAVLEAGYAGEVDNQGNLINKADKFYAILSSSIIVGYYATQSGTDPNLYAVNFDKAAQGLYNTYDDCMDAISNVSTKKQGIGTSLAHTWNDVLGYPPITWYDFNSDQLLKCFTNKSDLIYGVSNNSLAVQQPSSSNIKILYAIDAGTGVSKSNGSIITNDKRRENAAAFRIFSEVGNAIRSQCKPYE